MSYLDVAACNYNENYLIYSDGSVYSNKYDRLIKTHDNGKNSPYWSYVLHAPILKGEHQKKRNCKKFYVHRLVAEHFLPNPDNLRDVHHIDSNPKNNDVSNLEWLSHKDNCAQKIYPHPSKIIKERPNAYCYKGEKGKFVFRWQGRAYDTDGEGSSDIPKMVKYGKSLEEVIKIRDEYFASYNCVA